MFSFLVPESRHYERSRGLTGLFEIHHLFVRHRHLANPELFLHLLGGLNNVCYGYIHAYTVWFKIEAVGTCSI